MAHPDRSTTADSGDPFGGEPCTALVFYAVAELADEPGPATPALVLEPRWSYLLDADQAPNLTELARDAFVAEVERAAARAGSAGERQELERVRDWARAQRGKGILYELEPASCAGDGSARRIRIAWERARRA